MFTKRELNLFARFVAAREGITEQEKQAFKLIYEKMLIVKKAQNESGGNMFVQEEIDVLKICAQDRTLEDQDREWLQSVLIKVLSCTKDNVKPKVLIILSDGCFQSAYADRDAEVIISDRDNIDAGDDLYYPCLTGDTETEFEAAVQVEYERVLLRKAKEKRGLPLNEARIFIHDAEDAFPYNVQIEGDVIATYKTFDEALDFLNAYTKARGR